MLNDININNNINNTNFFFNKLDLDLIKYYSGNFTGVNKALKFIDELKIKINHLILNDSSPSDLSIFDFNYNIDYLDPKNIKQKYIPEKNIQEFEIILKNLYLKYSIDNEFFTIDRGFNIDQLLLNKSFEDYFDSEIKPGMFIYDLIDFDFETTEKKKQFLFNMLMFCMKDYNFTKNKSIDYRMFVTDLGEKISKHCLEVLVNNKNLRETKTNYILALSKLDFYDCNNEQQINIFKKFFDFGTNNLKLISHINNYMLYHCFEEAILVEKLESILDLSSFKFRLDENLNNDYFNLGKKIIDFLIIDKSFVFENDKISTQYSIIEAKFQESDIFDSKLPKFNKKAKKLKKYRINKNKLFRYLKALDSSRIKFDVKKFDKTFLTNLKSIEKVFFQYKEYKNFTKLFRYSCDFYCCDRFEYDPLVSGKLHLFHLDDLEKLSMTFYVRKLVFNSMMFRVVILLHFSHFFVQKEDFFFDRKFYMTLK